MTWASNQSHKHRFYLIWQLSLTMFSYLLNNPFSLTGERLVQPLCSEMLLSGFLLLLLLLFLWKNPKRSCLTFIGGLGPPSSTSLCWHLCPWFQCSFISETSEPKIWKTFIDIISFLKFVRINIIHFPPATSLHCAATSNTAHLASSGRLQMSRLWGSSWSSYNKSLISNTCF